MIAELMFNINISAVINLCKTYILIMITGGEVFIDEFWKL